MIEIFFKGETLADILPKIRKFLGDVSINPEDALLALDEPLPPALKRTSKKREGEPTKAEIRAASEAQSAVTRDDVKKSLDAFVRAVGYAEASLRAPKLMGAARLSDIPPNQYARAKRALDAAIDFL